MIHNKRARCAQAYHEHCVVAHGYIYSCFALLQSAAKLPSLSVELVARLDAIKLSAASGGDEEFSELDALE